MARKSPAAKPSTAVATRSTSIANIDQELANEVAQLKQQLGQPSGNAIRVQPVGSFNAPDGQDLGSEIQVVIVDFISKNMFYDRPYDPGTPGPPACYAAGKVIADMAPDPESPAIQSDLCSTCALNVFGSGSNGKSKACKNTRELVVLLVDSDAPDAIADPAGQLYTISLPPTALRSFDGIASTIARSLGGPPIKAIVTITAKNAGTYAMLTFSDPLPNKHYAQHAERRGEANEMLARKPNFADYQPVKVSKRPTPRPAIATRR